MPQTLPDTFISVRVCGTRLQSSAWRPHTTADHGHWSGTTSIFCLAATSGIQPANAILPWDVGAQHRVLSASGRWRRTVMPLSEIVDFSTNHSHLCSFLLAFNMCLGFFSVILVVFCWLYVAAELNTLVKLPSSKCFLGRTHWPDVTYTYQSENDDVTELTYL